MYSDKKPTYCHHCQNYLHNLVTLPCNHKLCINCIKNYKTKNNHCIVCQTYNKIKHKQSPNQSIHHQQKTLKQKILDKVKSSNVTNQLQVEDSPHKTDRTASLIQSNQKSNKKFSQQNSCMNDGLMCRQHHQNLIMYNQKNKQLYCAQCIYLKNTRNVNLIPIKNAIQLINSQNRINRDESRNSLSMIQNSIRVCSSNKQLFQGLLSHYQDIIHKQFEDLYKQMHAKQLQIKNHLNNLFDDRISEYQKILSDLEYLRASIKQYRQYNNKQNSNINNSIFVFSAYKIIKKTLKNIDLNYISYNISDLSILQFDKQSFNNSLKNIVKIKTDLPIKPYQIKGYQTKPSRLSSLQKQKNKKISHMQSIKQQSQTNINEKQKEKDKNNSVQTQNSSASKNKKKQDIKQRKPHFSLCSNLYEAPQKTLYLRLLNEKFNKYTNIK